MLGQNSPHNLPVRKRTPITICPKTACLMRLKDRSPSVLDRLELHRVNLMLGHEIRRAGFAAQEIRVGWFAESERRGSALLAEDDHVGEVGVFLGCDIFAEDAAGWEDGLDCADD